MDIGIPTQHQIKAGLMVRNNLITAVIKEDKKGNVYTALRFGYIIKRTPVIIKEGNSSMPADHFGRTMRDRLKWQMHVHRQLSNLVNVPKIVDFFDYKGNSYLVMEYVEGKTLRQYLADIFRGRIWHNLADEERLTILRLMFQLVNEVDKMHQLGFVHRDLTPDNLLVTPVGKLYLVDFELSYAIKEDYPSPPFALGTPGFISPEQRLRLRPEVTEDIFALGGVFLTAFSNFPPLKFDMEQSHIIYIKLQLLGVQWKLGATISGCIAEEKSQRTNLLQIRLCLDEVLSEKYISDKWVNQSEDPKTPDQWSIGNLMNCYFRLLISKGFNEQNNLYLKGVNAGLSVSINGIFYIMAVSGRDSMLGTVINFFKRSMKKNLETYYAACSTELPGLFCGQAGNALGFNSALQLGIAAKGVNYPQHYHWLHKNADTLDLANGIAGQAMSALLIMQTPDTIPFEKRIHELIQILLDAQAADGSWPLDKLRLADGVSGILLTLIKFYQLLPDDELCVRIKRGLKFLTAQFTTEHKNPPGLSADSIEDISLIGGSSGIALVLLYGYEHFGDPNHLDLAEQILSEQHERPCSFDFSLESGLAGLGIVYIEAARITGKRQWEKRAAWIFHLFDEMRIEDTDCNVHWNSRGLDFHDSSLLSGNAGIMYFLMRLQHYVTPDKKIINPVTLF